MNVCVWCINGKILTGKISIEKNASHFEYYHHKFSLELPGIDVAITSGQDTDNSSWRKRRFCHVIPGL